ncbi:hypothetical protein T4D_8277, partial [Trichinella pseudospiralis]
LLPMAARRTTRVLWCWEEMAPVLSIHWPGNI